MQRRTLLNLTLGAALILLTAKATLACFWDRDTLAQEAAGLPGVVEVLLGRIDRWPPEYYAMRLERVTQQLESEPNHLELYDDAAVASDRLKRYDEAIEWMSRKRAILDTLPESDPTRTEHKYRYLANLGTLHAHRWIARGGSADDLTDLERAIELIRAAIDLNPDAHFGREKVQLGFLKALRYTRTDGQDEPLIPFGVFRSTDPERVATYQALPEHDHYSPADDPDWYDHPYHGEFWGVTRLGGKEGEVGFLGSTVRISVDETLDGLTGLMVLGDAWQSVDVHESLIQALYEGRGDRSVALLAACRVAELSANGSSSLLYPNREPHAPLVVGSTIPHEVLLAHQIYEYFRTARPVADEINAERMNFVSDRLKVGRHPDTDPNFWDGYAEQSLPRPPNGVAGRATTGGIFGFAAIWGGSAASVVLILTIILTVRISGRWKRAFVLVGGIAIALFGGVFATLVLAGALSTTPDWSDEVWTSYNTFRTAMHSNQP